MTLRLLVVVPQFSSSTMSESHFLSHLLSPGQPQVSISQLLRFIGYITQLKDIILLAQPADYCQVTNHPVLSPTICTFISLACGLSRDQVDHFWVALAPTAWNTDVWFSPSQSTNFMSTFTAFGHELGISTFLVSHITNL